MANKKEAQLLHTLAVLTDDLAISHNLMTSVYAAIGNPKHELWQSLEDDDVVLGTFDDFITVLYESGAEYQDKLATAFLTMTELAKRWVN